MNAWPLLTEGTQEQRNRQERSEEDAMHSTTSQNPSYLYRSWLSHASNTRKDAFALAFLFAGRGRSEDLLEKG